MLSYLNDPTSELLSKIGCDSFQKNDDRNVLWDNMQETPKRNEVLFNLAKHCKKAFDTESGLIVLNFLIAEFLDKPTCNFGYPDGEQTKNYSIWRDGNNHVVREILNLIRLPGELI